MLTRVKPNTLLHNKSEFVGLQSVLFVPTHAFVYELKGLLAIMGNMILSKHLEHIWTSTHRLRGPSSKSRSGMQ